MEAAVTRFVEAAAPLGVEVQPVAYPEGTRTAADAAAAIGCELDQIVKSLVFVSDDASAAPVLALTAGGNRVDLASLAALAGVERLRKATADEARAATGFAIGGTPPFGHPAPVPTFLDPRLTEFDEVWAAAGTPSHVFPLHPDALTHAGAASSGDFTA